MFPRCDNAMHIRRHKKDMQTNQIGFVKILQRHEIQKLLSDFVSTQFTVSRLLDKILRSTNHFRMKKIKRIRFRNVLLKKQSCMSNRIIIILSEANVWWIETRTMNTKWIRRNLICFFIFFVFFFSLVCCAHSHSDCNGKECKSWNSLMSIHFVSVCYFISFTFYTHQFNLSFRNEREKMKMSRKFGSGMSEWQKHLYPSIFICIGTWIYHKNEAKQNTISRKYIFSAAKKEKRKPEEAAWYTHMAHSSAHSF